MCSKRHLPRIITSFFFGFIFAIFAAFTPLVNPVSAAPDSTTTSSKTETTTTSQTTTTDKTTATSANSKQEQGKTTDSESGDNCINQTGSVGWLVCPSTNVIATAVDALYSIIQNFLVIEPISFNTDSPVYNIWDYCRSITNIIFIIILLVVIFSQVTGLGFNNFNIKKTLPRIVVAAILINLSFILSSLLVDLSNIIGANLSNFFTGVAESAIENSGFEANAFELGTIVSTIVGGGTIAGAEVAVIATGGAAAFFWMLIPILLGAIVSVVTGLLTISLRQAVVVLLVMIAPLAIVANTLPNTEKWFTKWKTVLFQMLFFFPIFSFLFGASRLLSIVFISSATNVYGVILGLAIQVFPLIFSWQLMKMSNTALGAINSKLNNLAQRPLAASRNWAGSHQAVSKARHNAESRLPSARVNRFLEDHKARREADTARYQASAKKRSEAYASNVYNRRGQLTRRGESLYKLVGQDLKNTATATRLQAELNEAGFRADGTDHRIRSGAQTKRIAKTNKNIIEGVDSKHASDSFLESAQTANASSYAGRTEESREKILAIRNDNTLSDDEKMQRIAAVDSTIARTLSSITDPQARTQYMNNIFANAISAQAKSDKIIHDNYAQLYSATKLTKNIHTDFNKSFADKNYNSLEAAIDELAKRGDFDLIKESLEQYSGEIIDDVEMQKHLSDTLIKYKADSAPLWAYAKSINVRRAKNAKKPNEIAAFTTFEEFERGAAPSLLPTESKENTDSLSMATLVGDINNPAVAVTQDRTTFRYILESQQNGLLGPQNLGFKIKQLRSAASSGQMDGEQLANLNKLLTGGITIKNGTLDPDMKPEATNYVLNNKQAIRANIVDYLSNMAAGQLATMKESTFNALNDALMYIDGDATDYGTGKTMSKTFYDAIYTNAANNMNNILKSTMNTNIKNWLGIKNNRQ